MAVRGRYIQHGERAGWLATSDFEICAEFFSCRFICLIMVLQENIRWVRAYTSIPSRIFFSFLSPFFFNKFIWGLSGLCLMRLPISLLLSV